MKRIYDIILRECGRIRQNPVFLLSMVAFPVLVTVFFTGMMSEGQPQEMPVAIVDNDNTSMSRAITRQLDMYQTSHVTAHYASVAEARHAIQKNEIYAFLYIPRGMTEAVLSQRQPTISFYYSATSLTAGSLLYRDMKTATTLATAAVGKAVLTAKGMTERQAMAFLQPVTLDTHMINNPCANYNTYLSTMTIPACMMLFVMLLTTYTLGSELKDNSGRELMEKAGGNIFLALGAKLLPQTLLFVALMLAHEFYIFSVLGFDHAGGLGWIIAAGLLAVLAGQGFGVTIFTLIPSMRMSMSVCSLWGVLSFSMVGAAYPAFAMGPILEALTWLFPLRHYWLVYSLNVFNGYSIADSWPHVAILIVIAALPLLLAGRLARVLKTSIYIE
ncbi:MAG: ABC transporter permease [Prevotella sp.]